MPPRPWSTNNAGQSCSSLHTGSSIFSPVLAYSSLLWASGRLNQSAVLGRWPRQVLASTYTSDQADSGFGASQTVPSTSGGSDCKTSSSASTRCLVAYHRASTWQIQTSCSGLNATAACKGASFPGGTLWLVSCCGCYFLCRCLVCMELWSPCRNFWVTSLPKIVYGG